MGNPHTLRTAPPVLLVAAIGLGAAHGGGVDPTPFVGDWLNGRGSTISLRGGVGGITFADDAPLIADAAAPFSISVGDDSDLVLHLSCHCDVPLAIVGQQAHLVAPTTCSLFLVSMPVTATVTDLTMDLSATPPRVTIIGRDAQGLGRPPSGPAVGPLDFVIEGGLHKASDTPSLCGPDATAVGIAPYSEDGIVACPLGWVASEGVDILLSSNNDGLCPRATGAHGEGNWVLPQAERSNHPCASVPPANPKAVRFQFCRVDGRLFKPLTTDPDATEQFYAVLMLGSKCPNGSEEVLWQIDTPIRGDGSSCAGAVPASCGPNQALNLGSAGSTFHFAFCLFRAAATAEDTMLSFPKMAGSYAVFHDFDGLQPPWVMVKRWVRSQEGSGNRLVGPPDVNREIAKIVGEDVDHGLTFEMARVQ
jgi:hypothetical protein